MKYLIISIILTCIVAPAYSAPAKSVNTRDFGVTGDGYRRSNPASWQNTRGKYLPGAYEFILKEVDRFQTPQPESMMPDIERKKLVGRYHQLKNYFDDRLGPK